MYMLVLHCLSMSHEKDARLIKVNACMQSYLVGQNYTFGLSLNIWPYYVSASSACSGETVHLRTLVWALDARICDKYIYICSKYKMDRVETRNIFKKHNRAQIKWKWFYWPFQGSVSVLFASLLPLLYCLDVPYSLVVTGRVRVDLFALLWVVSLGVLPLSHSVPYKK